MRGGRDHARQTQPAVPDEGPTASGSTTRDYTAQQIVTESSDTQPTGPDEQSRPSTSGSNRGYQDVLINCNRLIEAYQKGEITKATV